MAHQQIHDTDPRRQDGKRQGSNASGCLRPITTCSCGEPAFNRTQLQNLRRLLDGHNGRTHPAGCRPWRRRGSRGRTRHPGPALRGQHLRPAGRPLPQVVPTAARCQSACRHQKCCLSACAHADRVFSNKIQICFWVLSCILRYSFLIKQHLYRTSPIFWPTVPVCKCAGFPHTAYLTAPGVQEQGQQLQGRLLPRVRCARVQGCNDCAAQPPQEGHHSRDPFRRMSINVSRCCQSACSSCAEGSVRRLCAKAKTCQTPK